MYNPNQDGTTDWFSQNDPEKPKPSVAPTGTGGGTPSQTAGNVTYTFDPTNGYYKGSDGNYYSHDPTTGAYSPVPGYSNGVKPTGLGSGTAGSLIEPFNESFKAPPMLDLGGPAGLSYVPQTPQFNAPQFQAPTAASVLSDPGYQFRLGQGEQALQQSAAGQGLINSGGTLKDVLQYGQNFASNEFQNAWNRNLDVYNTAFQSAAAAFAPQMTAYNTKANLGAQQNQQNYTNDYNNWLQHYTIFRNQQLDTFNKQYPVATA